VPVSHEEIRVEREPLRGGDADPASAAPAESGVRHEIVLHAERPVVTTEVVPVERVRVSTVTVGGQTTVTEPLREERIELETDLAPDAGR
jgi:stress response protein YsnF